ISLELQPPHSFPTRRSSDLKALSLAGGLHHGFSGKASGFCVYNDTAIACEYIAQKYGKTVLYIDTDAHHGDGVQWTFYNRKDIVTYSIHETGRYLFPGKIGRASCRERVEEMTARGR